LALQTFPGQSLSRTDIARYIFTECGESDKASNEYFVGPCYIVTWLRD